jgi:hypothetical protein
MGAWGPGLYSSDLAMDLKATVGAVVRLPFSDDRLVEILRATDPETADDPGSEEHTVFWLVVADQFEKRGIACAVVRDKALSLIDAQSDLRVNAQLGMSGGDLRKRKALLEALRHRIAAAPTRSKPRKVLKEPQAYILDVGGVYAYPTANGLPINPYLGSKYFDRSAWKPDGWGLVAILERGRVFDYLVWYQPIVAVRAVAVRPGSPPTGEDTAWVVQNPGTFSKAKWSAMELELLGSVGVDAAKVDALVGTRRPIVTVAVSDISFVDSMTVLPPRTADEKALRGHRTRTVLRGLRSLAP